VRAMELADEAGAAKSIRLQVGGAFHSELMKPVQSALAETMEGLTWSDPQVPLVANHSGEVVTTADDVRAALVAQIASPVRWVDCVQTLVREGCDRALELGPGRVLGGLIRKIDPELEPLTADSRQDLEDATARGGAGA
jgi:[acyl-carrier-protein] S-malonyltransferase